MEKRGSTNEEEGSCDDTLNQTIREPLCYYFSSNAADLRREIECCKRYFSPGPLQTTVGHSSPAILLVPHGAFCDSGPLVADALQRMFMDEVSTVLLIGTEHASTSVHKLYCSDHSSWRTPLGLVPIDKDLLHSVKKILPVDNSGFAEEHSIENQLPFLQTLLRRDWRMLAVNVHSTIEKEDLSYIAEIGRQVAALLTSSRKDVAILGTTDYTHAGPGYGDMPPGSLDLNIPEYIRMQDQTFLGNLCSDQPLSIEQLWEYGRRISMCGLGATLLVSEMAKNLGCPKARLLRYAVGSDVCERGLQDQTGFATVTFEA